MSFDKKFRSGRSNTNTAPQIYICMYDDIHLNYISPIQTQE